MPYKKILCLLLLMVCILYGTTISYGLDNTLSIQEIENPNKPEHKENIAKKVLHDTGKNEKYSAKEIENIMVYEKNIYGDEREEVLLVLKISPKNSMLVAYTPTTETNFTYLEEIGEFCSIPHIQFLPLSEKPTHIVLVQEEAKETLGAFSTSYLEKGFLWKKDHFEKVLDITENMEANWNDRWSETSPLDESLWKKITQNADMIYQKGKQPHLNVVYTQRFFISDQKDDSVVPEIDTYSTVEEEVTSETYFWSSKWQHFYLEEKKETQTGELVAVIEDFGKSPFTLLKEYETHKVRILRSDGRQEIVNESTLKENQSQT